MRFVRSTAPYPAYIGGIGSGKSFAGGAKVISRLDRKEIGMIVAPTYPMLRDSTLEGFFGLLESLGIPYEHMKSDNTISFASGHKILCRSVEDPDKVRGPNLGYVWGDECGYISRKAWQIIKGRVRVGSNPQAWLTGTPKGRDWLWEEWERDATGSELDPTHPLFRVRTEENPELPAGFTESLGYAGQFAAQELGGEFVAFEGLVYPTFTRPHNVRRLTDLDGWATVLGLDVGTRNPTSLSTYRYAGERLHKERELYQRGMSTDDIIDAAVAEYKRSKASHVVVDPSAAGLILSLQAKGVKCHKADNDILIGIGRVSSILPTFTIDPTCVNTIAEFESYAYRDGGKVEQDVPVKANDHALDELRYVVMDLYGKPKKKWGMK
jgi:phage terminase large subunit